MGNIADALEKAGVELIDKGVASEGENFRVDNERETRNDNHNFSDDSNSPSDHLTNLNTNSFDDWDERIDMVSNRSSQASEAFRVLRSRIMFPENGISRPKTIMVASSAPEEGKSFVSINLAVAIARGLDQYSLLVDCDLRRPSILRLLGMEGTVSDGLTEYLREESDLPALIHKTAVEKLSFMGSGTIPANPAELLSSGRMSRLVNELSGRYTDRFIIFDSPPFQVASEAIVLSKKVDGVVIVVGSGKSDRTKIKTMVENIGPDKVIGVVFNSHKEGYFAKKLFNPYGGYGHYYGDDKI
ncbi:polysaccharide biosynthesis tyrosine autokinase [Desulfosediminicola flagellatus]|uniref:polysaccharide biosynthesis tyrosine autokinase n=1 Tax=Desulfosediminicola flagellatus TaxID=2569541 RepID=UPI0010AD0086|nr:polysaccharide biosynthesis tyrosine autokinase [Desulfosediminicola flagellatus]